MRSGEWSAHETPALRTDETASSSSLYPTPAATSYGSNCGGAAGRVGTVRESLDSWARRLDWPTPTSTDEKASDAAGYSTASGAAGYSTASGRHSGTTLTDRAVRQWATPTARDDHGERNHTKSGRSLATDAKQWATPSQAMLAGFIRDKAKRKKATTGGHTRRHQGNELARQAERAWATPTSRGWRDGAAPSSKAPTASLLGRQDPRTSVRGGKCSSTGRTLNPRFVAWLMGFPPDWCEIATAASPTAAPNSDASETPSPHRRPRSHSKS